MITLTRRRRYFAAAIDAAEASAERRRHCR